MKYSPEILQKALEVKTTHGSTIREYLCATLLALWKEGENFSGKRPLGNNDWDIQISYPLIEEGFTTGKLDKDGYIFHYGNDAEFVAAMIKEMCGVKQ